MTTIELEQEHKLYDLEQQVRLSITKNESINESELFDTYVCFVRECNYFEYRLAEGHTEDK